MAPALSPLVQLQFLRPAQVEAAMRHFPVVYVPFGLIEWHGPQLPLGTDALKAHGICVKAAEAHGGLVYPPVYFAEPFTAAVMQPVFERLFARLKAMGFRVILAVTGHNTFSQRDLIAAGLAPVLASGGVAGEVRWECDCEFRRAAKAKYLPDGRLMMDGQETTIQRDAESCSDHAAKWETSDMQFFYPETVDLATLGTGPIALDMSAPYGIGGLDPRVHASAAVGRRNVELSVAALGRRARELLESLPADQRAFALPALVPPHWWAV